MVKALSKRAIEGRKWRICAREKRRLNTIVTRYIEEKHSDIYERCKRFYNDVVDRYSTVQNLTKTKEFRFFLEGITETDNGQATTSGTASDSNEQATVVSGTASGSNEQATVASGTASDSNEQATVVSRTASGSNKQATVASGTASCSNEQATVASGTASDSNEQATVASGTASGSNEQATVASGIGSDILSEAMCEIRDFSELDNMDAVVSGIIRELEANVQSIFDPLDEGIGLNVEDELGSLVEQYDPL